MTFESGDAKLTSLSANIVNIKKCIHISTMFSKAGLLNQWFPTWACPKINLRVHKMITEMYLYL